MPKGPEGPELPRRDRREPGCPEGPDLPEGPGRPEDDWDQEASLAAIVAEVEAKRAHGLVDIDDYYDLDDGYDLPDDYCGPGWPAAGRPEPKSAGQPRDLATRSAATAGAGCGACPGAWTAAGMMVVLIATAVRGSLRRSVGQGVARARPG